MGKKHLSLREEILNYAKKEYGTTPEYLWKKFPNYAVLRNSKNKKWYGVVMDIPKEKLGLNRGKQIIDVLNVKIGPIGVEQLIEEGNGFLKAYHMMHKNWVSILLDGSVEIERVLTLLSMSYSLVEKKKST